jgi:tRNA threonylcarbamoyladenosine biosynthesis protein TsaB
MILSIETSTSTGSLALHDQGRLLSSFLFTLQKSHSSLFPGVIDQLLSDVGVAKEDLHAIAVSSGPGSYTGLRIGVSGAKALCYGLNLPLISIPTLEILLEGVKAMIFEPALVFLPRSNLSLCILPSFLRQS